MKRLFLLLFLVACADQEREHVINTNKCLNADKRAVMICRRGHCEVECRERT